jgi:hypothetical protein
MKKDYFSLKSPALRVAILSLIACWLLNLSLKTRIPSAPIQAYSTANDAIKPYNQPFRYGTNMGYYAPHTDENLADLAAQLGVQTFRPALFHHFCEQWGYDIRVPAFEHYARLGIQENVVFIGYPSAEKRSRERFCALDSSVLFANMYTPIWLDSDRKRINPENHYAVYVQKLVKTYGKFVRFWEVWNEPDFSTTFKSEMAPGLVGAWWNTNPEPCEYALRAPIQHYIRLLRISYEVIKATDPNAYVCIGGIGYPSFLDAVLRQTDSPSSGAVSAQYPLKGGAYFDVLSYHTYPHIDGSVRNWSDKINGFAYDRHSDRAVAGVFKKKDSMETVLEKFGYNGATFPKKLWLITESNIPAKRVGEFMGSYEAQRNFLVKSLVKSQQAGILQHHIYQLAEIKQPSEMRDEFDAMGLFSAIENKPLQASQPTETGIAFATTTEKL